MGIMKNLARTTVTGAVALGAALVLLPGQASADEPAWWYDIRNVNSGQCLEIPGGQTHNGAPAQQWGCNGGLNQRWIHHERRNADGSVSVRYENAQARGKCLEVADWRTDPGAPLRVWDCHAGASQWWTDIPYTNSTVLRNDHSGLVADVSGDSTAYGAPVAQWNNKVWESQNANQRWRFFGYF
ncbi:RICIN domain-containing protein [Streptomyces sp. NPDC093249]|uniref:RICIN domain-containing protein n=1 Tax=unclassified Streptomyces TaxID=2593676 RepID=UPI003819C766